MARYKRVYPRRCGGTTVSEQRCDACRGLSPQVRGNRLGPCWRPPWMRSIPAGAGEPARTECCLRLSGVYPRRCGGTSSPTARTPASPGLSPQVRGNLPPARSARSGDGSIPAGAGEPRSRPGRRRWRGVYPRRCGGTAACTRLDTHSRGLSPQVRGNPPSRYRAAPRPRSIPAGAGEPCDGPRTGARSGVYPRRCGGTLFRAHQATYLVGLSPQVRGNPVAGVVRAGERGSIPAGAGEPEHGPLLLVDAEVYPRRCGGTSRMATMVRSCAGLSPQVRGNLPPAPSSTRAARSIPAGAGEPRRRTASRFLAGVYPRRCGGTIGERGGQPHGPGLSPQVWGNRSPRRPRSRCRGSIPAGAGEPASNRHCASRKRVYPRRCGGTMARARELMDEGGLSPRVRGNPGRDERRAAGQGSIPAGAGEPRSPRGGGPASGVYPRRCGGTRYAGRRWSHVRGLSPQVRGNRRRPAGGDAQGRSIPAGAGEPPRRRRRARPRGVYPRRCGGTALQEAGALGVGGLSPQVRGNREAELRREPRLGSIPAGAGEPAPTARGSPPGAVYPRRCGGTSPARLDHLGRGGLSPQVRGNHHGCNLNEDVSWSIPAGAGEPSGARPPGSARRVYPRRCGGTVARTVPATQKAGLSPQVRGNRRPRRRRRHHGGSIPAGAGEPRTRMGCAGSSTVYPRRCGGTI